MHTIIFVDVVKSTDLKMKHGDALASEMIAVKLNELGSAMRHADKTSKRYPPEGDSFLLTGDDTLALFQCVVKSQYAWKAWPENTAVRIAIGWGEYVEKPDGLVGVSIDHVRRILDHCKPGGIAVTEGVREILRSSGHGHRLFRRTAILKGIGEESFYIVDEERVDTDEYKTTQAQLQNKCIGLITKLEIDIQAQLVELNELVNKFVTNARFKPVQMIAYGTVWLVLTVLIAVALAKFGFDGRSST